MQAQAIIRKFIWRGTELPDPNPSGTVQDVQTMLAHTHPEIANAAVDGPKMDGAVHKYTFVASVGTKG